MKPILFIDRDGTIIQEPADEQIDSLEKLEFLPKVLRNLYRLQEKYTLVMVTNQDGLGTDSFPENTFWPAHNKMMGILTGEDIHFHAIHIDEHFPADNHPNRKPGIGMMTEYIDNPEFDLTRSFVLGDRLSDTQLAKNLGCKGIFIASQEDKGKVKEEGLTEHCALVSDDWDAIGDFLMSFVRRASVHRKTAETSIEIDLDIDGVGDYHIDTGVSFLDHMLDQVAKHAGIDLHIKVEGDLHIDAHHTVEDTALALGEAFDKAMGNKAGMERYGHFSLPMDEALADVALDFSGRPWLVWKAAFRTEMVGQLPTEMVQHFFKSFADTSRCTLNMKVTGDNDHHQVEALFKGFAKALKMALKRDGSNWEIPSTKGVL